MRRCEQYLGRIERWACAQECVRNCKCAPMHINALWDLHMSIKVRVTALLAPCSMLSSLYHY